MAWLRRLRGPERADAGCLERREPDIVAVYPLLLVIITIFGFIGAASLGHGIVSTLHEFPVVGGQFNPASSESLQGSGLGLAIGIIGLIYGAQGVTQIVQQAMAGVWNVPQIDRPTFLPRLARSLIALITIGCAFVLNAAVGTVVTGMHVALAIRGPALVGMVLLNVVLYATVFWVTTPGVLAKRNLLPGAAVASLGFTVLITLGTCPAPAAAQLRDLRAVRAGDWTGRLSLSRRQIQSVWGGIVSSDPTAADNQLLSGITHQSHRREDQVIGVAFGEDGVADAATDADSLS